MHIKYTPLFVSLIPPRPLAGLGHHSSTEALEVGFISFILFSISIDYARLTDPKQGQTSIDL